MVRRTKWNNLVVTGYRPYESSWFRRHQTEADFLKMMTPLVDLPDTKDAFYGDIVIPQVIFLGRGFNRCGADMIIPVRLSIGVRFGTPFLVDD